MTFLPIVARELRVASRRPSTYRGRLGAAILSLGIAAVWLPIMASHFTTSQGKLLFRALSTLGFVYCLFAGARATSDCLSAEKRDGTIGLLFLTDLRGYDVVLGKLVSSSLGAVYGLLAIVPVMSLALLLGGVTLGEVARMALLLLNTLLFSLSAGVLVSSLSSNDRRAMFATLLVIIVVAGVPYTLASVGMFVQMQRNLSPSILEYRVWLMPSPAYAFERLSSGSFSRIVMQDFYGSLVATHLLTWLFLAAASVAIPRLWRERPSSKLKTRWADFRNRWCYGDPARRRALGRRLLDRNAFYWLGARDRMKRGYVWIFVAALALIWAAWGWGLGGFIFDWDISFWLLFCVFVFFKIWLSSEICSRLVEDRASGAFELLLSSPLQPAEMARGQDMALRRQFGAPVAVVLALTWLLLSFALRSATEHPSVGEVRVMFWALMLMAVADLATLKWVARWEGIQSAQIHRAILSTCKQVMVLPTILFVVLYGIGLLVAQASDPALLEGPVLGAGALLWLAIGLLTDLWLGVSARWRFLHHFRTVATQRYAPRTARLQPFQALLSGMRNRFLRRTPGASASSSNTGWSRALIVAPAVVLLAGVLVFGFWKHSMSRAVDSKLAAIKSAGQPLTLPDLDAWGPALREEENGAVLVQKAIARFVQQPPLPKGVRREKMEWPDAGAPLPEPARLSISNWVSLNRQTLDLVHAAASIPGSRHPIFWRNMMPGIAPWQSLFRVGPFADLLQFEALLRCEEDDPRAALESVRALFGLAHALSQEPLLAGLAHRRHFLAAALRSTERIVSQFPLEEQGLLELEQQLYSAEIATPPALVRAFIGERCVGLVELSASTGRASPWGPAPSGWDSVRIGIIDSIARISGLRDRHCLKYLDAMDDCIRIAGGLASPQVSQTLQTITAVNPQFQWRTQTELAATKEYWHGVIVRELECIALLRAARTGIKVERFRRQHEERLPGSLSELSSLARPDEFKSPEREDQHLDPFSARPLVYVPLKPGYVIYSIGKDRQDERGMAEPSSGRTMLKQGYDLPFRVSR